MKRYTKVALLVLCLAAGKFSIANGASTTCAEVKIETIQFSNGIHPRIARRVIREACCQMGMSFQWGWVRYRWGVNTITPIPNGYRVSLLTNGGGFVIVDIIDDL